MKRLAIAVLLLLTLNVGISFGDDPWGPKMPSPQPGVYSLTDAISQMWEKLLSCI